MPILAKCPTCEHSYNLPEGQRGKRVRCRNCADIFVAGGKGRGRDEDEVEDVELIDDDEGTPAPRKKKSSSSGGSVRDRLDREDASPRKRKGGNPDRDDDDDDDSRSKSGGGGSLVPLLAGIGGVILLMIIGVSVAIFWATSRAVNSAQNLANNIQQDVQNKLNNPGMNPGMNPGINPIINPNPGPPKRDTNQPPANIDEALADITDHWDNPLVPKWRAEWLSKQNPTDADRQKVCDALFNTWERNPHHFNKEEAYRAFCKWASAAQSAQLLKLIDSNKSEAMEAVVRLKLVAAVPPMCKKAAEDWGQRGTLMANLEKLGPALVEKELVKYINHTDHGLRNDVSNLLKKWNTKPDVMLDQVLVDVGSTKQEVAQFALERLGTLTPEGSTKTADVVKALKPHILSQTRDIAQRATQAALVWGKVELVNELILAMETNNHPFDRRKLMEEIGKIDSDACRQAVVRHLNTPGLDFQAATLIRNSGKPAFEPPLLEALKTTTDMRHRHTLFNLLTVLGTPASIPVIRESVKANDPLGKRMADQVIGEITKRALNKQ